MVGLLSPLTGLGGMSLSIADTPATTAPVSAFDEAKHMRVDEVKPGMLGYGYTVFSGHTIERFEVKVIAVQKNFNVKEDVILVRCLGERLEHTGVIAGMSGSPIFLTDAQGREKMVGAIAYGWGLAKDPIAGVQPVQYMMDLPTAVVAEPEIAPQVDKVSGLPLRWSITEAVMLPGMKKPPAGFPLASLDSMEPNPAFVAQQLVGRDARLVPLASPLMVGGMSAELSNQFAPLWNAFGLMPLQAGGGAAAPPADADGKKVVIERGSSLAVPLVTGDLDLTALGTCTEVIGNRVYGFGHPFQGEGPVQLPMATGYVTTVIPTLINSFKLGGMTEVVGTLAADQSVGIAGEVGVAPPMIPVDITVLYKSADGKADVERSFHFDIAQHPRFTPMLGTITLMNALVGQRQLPENHTLNLDLNLEFANGKKLVVKNTAVNTSPADLFYDVGMPIIAAGQNPFKRVGLSKISGNFTVEPVAKYAEIIDVHVPRTALKPGETIKAFVTYRPFRQAERVLPIEMPVPKDLPDGTYTFSVSDWSSYMYDEQMNEPFRFITENIDQVFTVMKEMNDVKRDALYVRLMRQGDGVAVGRAAMPRLPASQRQVLLGAGRSNTTAFVSSNVQVVPTDYVFNGQTSFEIEIDRNPRAVDTRPKQPGKAPTTAPAS